MYPGFHAAQNPHRTAVVMAETGTRLSYGELEERSARLANVFREQGLREGDVVALFTDNNPRAFEVYWAAMRCGLYLCAINSHLNAAEVSYIVNDSGARVLVVSGQLRDIAADVLDEIPAVPLRLCYAGSIPGCRDLDDALAEVSAHVPDHQPCGAALLYSSGTTGHPKGIRPALPGTRVDDPPDRLMEWLRSAYGIDEDTVYLSPGPLYHAAPLRYCASVLALGGTVVMMRRFEAATALRAIEHFQVTHSQWVPTMFVRMLKLDPSVRARHDLSSHRVAIHAAAPCPVDVKRSMIEWWGPILYEYYSCTEAIGTTLIDSAQWQRKPGSVGKSVLGTLRICADDGSELPVGEIGTVYFEQDEITFEYLGDPEKTRSTRHPEHANWATVGDLGYLDAEGFLYLTDRKSFMIISGGVNIYPQETENVLVGHPAVLDVAVIGVPDPEMGESVKAVVQPTEDVTAVDEGLERELIHYVRERLAHYKAPRNVDFVAELPRTATGKLVKNQLRERYAGRSSAS